MVSHIYRSLNEKDLGEDSNHTNEPSPNTRDKLRALIKQSFPGLIIAILVFIVLFGLATVSGFAVGKNAASRLVVLDQPSPQPQAFFPNFGKVSTVFVADSEYTRNDTYGDQLWDGLVPIGAGYVRVPNPRQYRLPASQVVKDNGTGYAEMYQASVIHQLHCMGVLRNYTRAYEAGIPPPFGGHFHVKHCIEYVRQAILCTADTTLEQANAGGGFTAQGAVPQCRDWNLVKGFLETNRADDFHPTILDT
ncbi:hypothetical protein AUEXF2481DRAFT_9415 [Aureobasidium subglaciale EXF-2481]|uniref:Oxidase ustYa n=1 Tax=Aureobasidium subglaciale (strain EXF-2481) TaxID=1043005 RepID=A0A074XY79_AURSE|nr:uncharacterized protein AUEXF2481DRAFT_9415 [Aureobasidium subglaciale EXF-2481]KEQ90518.1 hypothetical protein AUEXF2481DRAFT_9415 [Aureobasidium subglaciale EXF-2481]